MRFLTAFSLITFVSADKFDNSCRSHEHSKVGSTSTTSSKSNGFSSPYNYSGSKGSGLSSSYNFHGSKNNGFSPLMRRGFSSSHDTVSRLSSLYNTPSSKDSGFSSSYNSRASTGSGHSSSYQPRRSTDGRFSSLYNSLASSESSHQPIAHKDRTGFGGYQTEFYTFTAPEDAFDDHIAVEKIAESLAKKNRVIFIKNPEHTAYENALLTLAQQAAEQKTAIYVLNKQHDFTDLAEKFNTINSNVNRKPEVHFVKYRTAEDAYNAQRAIQSQYDSLDGSVQSYNGGHTPVHDYAAPLFHGPFQTPNSDFLLSSDYPRFRA